MVYLRINSEFCRAPTGPIDPLAVHHGSRCLIRGLLKWLRQTLDRAPWLMAIEPGPTVNRR
jgi:hypothetical protein